MAREEGWGVGWKKGICKGILVQFEGHRQPAGVRASAERRERHSKEAPGGRGLIPATLTMSPRRLLGDEKGGSLSGGWGRGGG